MPSTDAWDPRGPVVVWGAGAMGGSIGAWLHRAGHPVLLVDQDKEQVAAIREHGLRITGVVEHGLADLEGALRG